MRYIQHFENFESNPRMEVDGFELTNQLPQKSQEDFERWELDQISLILNTHSFSDKIQYYKYDNGFYYVQHNEKTYECRGFEGLIKCINFIGSLVN